MGVISLYFVKFILKGARENGFSLYLQLRLILFNFRTAAQQKSKETTTDSCLTTTSKQLRAEPLG